MKLIKVTIVGPGYKACELLAQDEILARSGLYKTWDSLDAGAKNRAARQAALQIGSGSSTLIFVYRVAVEEIAVMDVSKADFLKISARYEQIENNFKRGGDCLTEAIAGKALRDLIAKCPWHIEPRRGVVPAGTYEAA